MDDKHASRYKPVQKGFWWRISIGDGTQTVGKFHTKVAAEKCAAVLLRAFRDGEFAAKTNETHDAEIARLRKEFDSVMELLQAERRYTESLNERLVKSDLAEIQRLRALLAETQELHRIEKRDAALARDACAEAVAERDAARAKIAEHNAAMDAECHESLTFVAAFPCGTEANPCSICPRRHRIEVEA